MEGSLPKSIVRVVAMAACALTLAVGIAGCAPDPAQQVADDVNAQLESIVTKSGATYDNIKSNMDTSAADLEDSGITTDQAAQMVDSMLDGFSYTKVTKNEVSVDGDTATVDVDVTAKRIDKVYENMISDLMSWAFQNLDATDEEVTAQGIKILMEETDKAEPEESTLSLTYKKDGGKWVADTDINNAELQKAFGFDNMNL